MAKTTRLATVIASAADAQNVYTRQLALAGQTATVDRLTGLVRTYLPRDDSDTDTRPAERKKVEVLIEDNLKDLAESAKGWLDLMATRDMANTIAKADVVIDGETVIKDAPPPLLLALEKLVGEWMSLIERLPTHPPGEKWDWSQSEGVWVSKPVETLSTKRKKVPLRLAAATDKHAEQAIAVDEDVVVGTWTTTLQTGSIPEERKRELLGRARRLLAAIKEAREEANTMRTAEVSIGETLTKLVFG